MGTAGPGTGAGAAVGLVVDPLAGHDVRRLTALARAADAAAVVRRGGQPRRRSLDLVIAATASVHGVPLLTHNPAGLALVSDLLEIRSP